MSEDKKFPSGTRLGRYLIEGSIGSGGMGDVYLAHDPDLARQVALKVLRVSADAEAEDFVATLAHEARSAAALNHPSIATIYEISEGEIRAPTARPLVIDTATYSSPLTLSLSKGPPDELPPRAAYIAMEYVAGKTLWHHGGGRPLPVEEVFAIAIQVAEALAAAHEKGIVHRDIKSDNVILTAENRVKVLDFGLAKHIGVRSAPADAPTRRLSGPKDIIVGTVSYMSPEQALGRDVDARSDIFSFGIVLYEMLTGKLPFEGATLTETINNVINYPAPEIADLRPNVPAGLERIVRRCLEKDRETRYSAGRDLAIDLKLARRDSEGGRTSSRELVGGGLGGSLGGSQDGDRADVARRGARPAAGRWSLATALLLVAGIGGIGIGVWWLARRHESAALSTAPIAAPRQAVAVLPFQNLSGDHQLDWLERGLAEMFVIDLAQLGSFSVVSPERVFDEVARLEKGKPAGGGSPSHARELARRLAVETVALGSLAQAGGRLRLVLSFEDPASGRLLFSGKADGGGVEDIFRMVDELTRQAGESLAARDIDAPSPALAARTTESLAAYRAYQNGRELSLRYYWAEALQRYEEAVQIDPKFALGWFGLGHSRMNLGDQAGSRAAFERAKALLPAAAEKDRLYVDGYLKFLDGDRRASIVAFRRLTGLDPGDKMAWRWLGYFYSSDGQTGPAINALERAVAIDPDFVAARNTLAYSYARREEYAKALGELERCAALSPKEANPYDSLGDILTRMGRYDEAIANYRRVLEIKPEFSEYSSYARIATALAFKGDFMGARRELDVFEKFTNTLGRSEALRLRARLHWSEGHSRSALAALAAALDLARAGDSDTARAALAQEMADSLAFLKREAEALRWYDQALELGRDSRLLSRIVESKIAALARFGKVEDAEALLADHLRQFGERESSDTLEIIRLRATARLAQSRGNWPGAVAAWRAFRTRRHLKTANAYELGIALLGAGDLAAAEAEFDQVSRHLGEGPFAPTTHSPMEWAMSHYFLGEVRTRRGDPAGARQAWDRFLALWGNADFPVPEVEIARREVAALGAR